MKLNCAPYTRYYWQIMINSSISYWTGVSVTVCDPSVSQSSETKWPWSTRRWSRVMMPPKLRMDTEGSLEWRKTEWTRLETERMKFLLFSADFWPCGTLYLQAALGHDYVADVEQHSSQKDAAKGFGGKFGVQKDRVDKVRRQVFIEVWFLNKGEGINVKESVNWAPLW